jgi:hypothetical protein
MPFWVLNWIRFRSMSASRISVRALPANRIIVEQDAVRWATGCCSGAGDLVVEDRQLLDRGGVVEVDVGEGTTSSQIDTIAVIIELVAVNDDVAIHAAATDRANGVVEGQAVTAVVADLVLQDPNGVNGIDSYIIVEQDALVRVITDRVVLDGDVLVRRLATRYGFTAQTANARIGDADATPPPGAGLVIVNPWSGAGPPTVTPRLTMLTRPPG